MCLLLFPSSQAAQETKMIQGPEALCQLSLFTIETCILRIGAGATSYWDSAHAVIGVGYTSGATSTSGSIRVNSGWYSLGYVYIGTSIPSHIVA